MRRLLALVILAAAIGGFLWLKASRPVPPPVEPRERVWRIAAETFSPEALSPTLTLYGRIEAPDRVRSAAPVAGRIDELRVRDGDRVSAGQVLLRMDERDLQPRLAQARAEVERERIRARADRDALVQERTLLQLAETKLARFDRLTSARLGTETAADQAREEVSRARLAVTLREQAIAEHPARLVQLESRLEEAERDAARGEVTAPFDARVGKVEVAAGDQVQAGQTLLALYPSGELYLRARLPVVHVTELRDALARGERLPARLTFGGLRLEATLVRIAGEADARGVEVLLRLDDDATVPVGAFVDAELQRPRAEGVLALPFAALHGGDRVYQVIDGRLRAREVERIGERRDHGEPRMIVRVRDFSADAPLMVTHLPNAIDGLAVAVVEPGALRGADGEPAVAP
ncbi:MAG: efflux RND transporter periplasmic adaptor subunit [Rhodocyclaceae bacterium]